MRLTGAAHSLRREEALGEGGDEADLDQQADPRFERCQLRHDALDIQTARKEAAAMERGQAKDDRTIRLKGMSCCWAKLVIGEGEAGDGCQIPEDATTRMAAVAGEQRQEPGEEPTHQITGQGPGPAAAFQQKATDQS